MVKKPASSETEQTTKSSPRVSRSGRKEFLERSRRHLEAQAEEIRQMLSSHVPQAIGLAGDLADGAVGESLASNSALENGRLSERLAEIEESLVLIRQGAYGICAYCEQKIPQARLNALPSARFCVRHAD